jgi:hypothetical protein
MKKTTTKKTKAMMAAPTPVHEASTVEAVVDTPAKKPAGKNSHTTIIAKIDVGYGNFLYIRGEGPGLSWDRGLVMDCAADDQWTVTISDATQPIVFKLLLNDVTWSAGDDCSVEPDSSITVEPVF